MSTFQIWLRGLAATFISGGSGAVTATVSVCVISPTQFNLHAQILNLLSVGAATFVMNGLLGVLLYLKQSPLPGVSEKPSLPDVPAKLETKIT